MADGTAAPFGVYRITVNLSQGSFRNHELTGGMFNDPKRAVSQRALQTCLGRNGGTGRPDLPTVIFFA
jgi:hypothetical protein